jgi:hypothetical protein
MTELIKRLRSEGLTDGLKTEFLLWLLEWDTIFSTMN